MNKPEVVLKDVHEVSSLGPAYSFRVAVEPLCPLRHLPWLGALLTERMGCTGTEVALSFYTKAKVRSEHCLPIVFNSPRHGKYLINIIWPWKQKRDLKNGRRKGLDRDTKVDGGMGRLYSGHGTTPASKWWQNLQNDIKYALHKIQV